MKHHLFIIILLIPLLLLVQLSSVAQSKFKKIVGTAITIDKNIAELEAKAILDAKNNTMAYFNTDTSEYIVFDTMPYFESHRAIVEECKLNKINELVIVEDSKITHKLVNNKNKCTAIISGNISKNKKVKNRASIYVSGLQDSYYNGDLLTFNIRTTFNSYVSAFVFEENQGWKIYPTANDPCESMPAGSIYNYPINDTKIFLEKSNMRNNVEYNTIILIATNNPIEYNGDNTFESVVKWIYTIPYQERDAKLYNIKIK